MKKNLFITSSVLIAFVILTLIFTQLIFAANPIITNKYLADPNACNFNGRMYIYCSHDLNSQTGYDMIDFTLISSADMVNWTDHGEIFQVPRDASWAGRAYAPTCTYKNGKYYLYYGNGGANIGVAVSDSPTGPFKDPIGKALITTSMPNCNVQWCFDPGVFVDDDGQAYLYFGGGGPGNARVIKLNDDMISTNGSAVTIDAPYYFEAPFMHKYKGKYYYSYSTNFDNGAAKIDYMMSDNPMTGFVHKGTVLDNPPNNFSNNNHASIVEFNNQWYIAYHNRKQASINGVDTTYHRSVCIDRLYYNTDGTIKKVVPTETGPEQIIVSPVTTAPQTSNNRTTVVPTTVAPTTSITKTTAPATTTQTTTTSNSSGCSVNYAAQNDWGSGATVSVTIKNNGNSAISNWKLQWTFSGNQKITNIWNGEVAQNGTSVSVQNASYNANIPSNNSVSFGFNLTYSGTNTKPTVFTLNGSACSVQ